MKAKKLKVLTLALSLVVAGTELLPAAQTGAFDELVSHYEEIRLALLHDSTDGVANHAAAIKGHLPPLE